VLSALAQLGTYETGAERALVSLFDSTYQYIVAEARPPKGAANPKPSLYGTALPRHQTACDHVLALLPQNGISNNELPLSIVPDLAKDARFTSKDYCQYGKGSQFYAGVPIRTGKGINIGTFCVMNEKQPALWDDDCLQHLRDISAAIMHHLETRRSSTISRRHERVNTGIGSFLGGKGGLAGLVSTTAYEAQNGGPSQESNDQTERKQPSHPSRVAPSDQKHETGNLSLERADVTKTSPHPDGTPNLPTDSPDKKDQQTLQGGHLDADSIFRRAASIIQQAFEVDGCAFMRVPYGSYRDLPSSQPNDAVDAVNSTSSASSGDEQQHNATEDPQALLCETIAHVVKESFTSVGKEFGEDKVCTIPKTYMAKLLRKYPRGTIFSLDAAGELQSSDSSEEDGTSYNSVTTDAARTSTFGTSHEDESSPQERQTSRRQQANIREAANLRQAFPSARSIVFVPVWDSKRERWLSGGFVYTCVPNRPFSWESDLSLLDAFSRLVASEVLNAETQKAERAKSDALGSLSHELRSPLHGINLSTELLSDTDLSVFQGNALHTIEVCCRTMLDTIDHLLDFSKVNSLAAGRARDSSAGNRYRQPKNSLQTNFGKKSLLTNVRLDGLVEEVVASVFAGFNFQHMSVTPRSAGNEITPARTLIAAHKSLDRQFAADQLSAMFENQGTPTMKFGNTSVYITIDPTCDWLFHTHPGAIRRIVMNLFGNSLKYTSSGSIRVSLYQESSKRSTTERLVKLTVQDTGKGIGEDYLRNGIFQPFTQEDKLSQGTGLGLSLVKKITHQLHGKILVESQIGVGTTFTITLPLEKPSQSSAEGQATGDTIFEKHLQELRGLRVVIHGFESEGNTSGRSAIEAICTGWLRMEVLRDSDNLRSADLVVRSEDTLSDPKELNTHLSQTPNVVVSRNAPAAWRLFTANEGVDERSVFEYMSQP
jgi:signal transduction histidine kinase